MLQGFAARTFQSRESAKVLLRCIVRARSIALTVTAAPSALQARFSVAHDIIAKAGALANGYFARLGSLTIKSKGAHDLVSEADVLTENLIRDGLRERFPEDAFLGEESGLSDVANARGIWVVDPIDGTQPFLLGMPHWCISIAYVEDGVLQFGLILNPPCDELFAGGKGFPATVNGRPIEASAGTDFASGLVSIGFSARTPHAFLFDSLTRLLNGGGMFYRNGSGALSLVYVAAGRLLAHVEPHMHPWDCLGAYAIIEAAGGRVNDYLFGDALLKGNRVIAGAPGIYDQLAALLEYDQS